MPSVKMTDRSLPELAEKLRDIDFCMLTTRTDGGELASRPMSTNRDVEYDGDSFFFTMDETRTVGDIEKDKRVSLGFSDGKMFFSTVEGEAELIRDKQTFRDHWNESIEEWFPQKEDTPGLVLIQVKAKRIAYWDGMEAGEVKV